VNHLLLELYSGLHAIGHAGDTLVAISNPIKSVLQPLVNLLQGILEWFWTWTGSWGLSIILLTICVRIVIFPLTWKQIKSQLAMASLQPKIKELQRKYKGDKAKLQQETMKLYQEYKVNPFASCFPLVLQIPIFISLYYAIQSEPRLQAAHFLWFILGKPDPWGFSIGPLYISVLMVIYIATQLVSTELMMTPETPGQQKWLMRGMPFAFAFFLAHFPAGLFLYWITTNLWTIGQTLIVRYMRAKHPVELTPDKVAKRKESRFMQAMHAAQQQQRGKPGDDGDEGGTTGKPVKSGQRPPQRPGGKPGARPAGKQTRPDGRPVSGQTAKPGQRPQGKPGAKPGTAPAGQRQGAPGQRPQGTQTRPPGSGRPQQGPRPAPSAQAAPPAQSAPAPQDGDGQNGGSSTSVNPPSKAIGSRPATKSASGKRPAKPKKRPSGGGS
jgi:YidC/Oxa1 family membrane protein insertase